MHGMSLISMDLLSRPGNRRQSVKHVILPAFGAVAASLCCATAGCGELPAPTAPSSPSELAIRGTTLLMPGHSGTLTAWLAENGNLREVAATWSTDGDIVSLTSAGAVTANRLGGALVRARYGTHEGQQTVHVVTSIAGTWRGSITVVDCWGGNGAMFDPCRERRGLVAPIVIDVTQSATADNFDNLRATVGVLTPPATGGFVGATDSSGQVFLDGYVERPGDLLGGALKLRWMLDAGRLVPFVDHPISPDMLDVQLSVRTPSPALVHEAWRLSAMSR